MKIISCILMVVLTFTLGFFVTAYWTDYQTDRDLQYGQTIELEITMTNPHQETCELHGETLQQEKVRAKCNERSECPNSETFYPFSNKWFIGDCIYKNERLAWVLFCQKCRDIETEMHFQSMK